MQGEIQFIKKQIFGGFNRKDVVAYIAKMAKERNEAREAAKEALAKVEALTEELEALKLELENSKKTVDEEKDSKTLQNEIEHQSNFDDEPDAEKNVEPDAENDQKAAETKKIKAKVIQKVRAKPYGGVQIKLTSKK